MGMDSGSLGARPGASPWALGVDRFARLREAVERVEYELQELRLPIQEDIPDDLRYKLMVCACSINDYVLWVERLEEQGEYGDRWRCNEIETGCHKDGDHAAEAVYRYFGWKPGDESWSVTVVQRSTPEPWRRTTK